MDYYLKGGDRDYMLANPQNLRPVFSQEQLATSLRATCLQDFASDVAALVNLPILFVDTAALVEDIKEGLLVDPIAKQELDLCVKGSPSTHFLLSPSGLLLMDSRVYVPNYRPERGNLRTCVLQEKHDHPTASHLGFNKTLELLCHDYTWPQLRTDCKKFVTQCVLCARNKPLVPLPLWPIATVANPQTSLAFDQYGLH